MKKFLRSTRRGWMIFNEADKGGAGGSAAPSGDGKPAGEAAKTDPEPTPEKTPVTEPEKTPAAAPAPAATEAAKPNVFQRAAAMLKDKAELNSEISRLTAETARLTSELSTATSQLETVTKERDGMKGQIAEFEKTVDGMKAEKKTVEAAAADKVASFGFPENKLPAASSAEATDADAPKTIADFQKKHGELSAAGKTDEASKYYSKYAAKLGL